MTKRLEKLIGRLSGFERISIGVTAFYCLGLVVRMQSEILHGLPPFVEINRALPFAVATQYLIFLFVPFVSFILPWRLSRPFLNLSVRLIVLLVSTLFFLAAFPMMLHYFMPFTSQLMPVDVGYWCGWLYIIRNFWRLYFSWASHLLGFGFLLIAYVLPSSYRQNAVFKTDVSLKGCRLLLLFMGIITNIFYFNSSVYCNISQGVFGAARAYGMLTIRNAPQSLLDEYFDMPSRYADQFSFPCSIEGRSEDWLVVSKAKKSIPDFSVDANDLSKGGIMAIKMADVVMFNPMHQLSYKLNDSERLHNVVMTDSIYRMDVEVDIQCVVTNGDNSISLASSVGRDVKANLEWFIGGAYNGGTDVCRVYPVFTDSTNVNVKVIFPQVSYNGLRTLSDLGSVLSMSDDSISVRIEGFSELIAPYQPVSIGIVLQCNFWCVYKVHITNYQIEQHGNAWLFSTSPRKSKPHPVN